MANPLAVLGQLMGGLTTIGAQGGRGALEGAVEGTVLKSKLDTDAEENKLRAMRNLLYTQQYQQNKLPWDELHAGNVYTRNPLTGALELKSSAPLDPLKDAQRIAALSRARVDEARAGEIGQLPPTLRAKYAAFKEANPNATLWDFTQAEIKLQHTQQGPVVVGRNLVDRNTGTSLFTAPMDPQRLGPGTTLLDPNTRQPLYTVPPRPEPNRVLGPGATLTSPSGTPLYTAPARPEHYNYPKERLHLIASGGIQDPQVSPAAAKKALDDIKEYEIGLSGGKAKSAAEARGEASAAQLTPETIDREAQSYLQTGKLPALGFGGHLGRTKIMNRATELAKETGIPFNDLVPRQMAMRASQAELTRLQTQRGQVMAFAKAADKNLDIALELSDKVDRTDIQAVNAFLQTGRKQFGSVEASNFAAAVEVGVRESARVLSGSMAGPVTDKSRQEIHQMLSTAQSPAQFKGALQVLRRDMNSRKEGYDEQIREIQESMKGAGAGGGGGGGKRDAIGPDGKEGKLPANTDLSQYPGFRWKDAGPSVAPPARTPVVPPSATPAAPPPPPSAAPRMPERTSTSLPPIPESANPAYVQALVREVLAQHYKGLRYIDLQRIPGAHEEFNEILKQRYWSKVSPPRAATP